MENSNLKARIIYYNETGKNNDDELCYLLLQLMQDYTMFDAF